MPFLLKNGPNSNKVEKGHILPLSVVSGPAAQRGVRGGTVCGQGHTAQLGGWAAPGQGVAGREPRGAERAVCITCNYKLNTIACDKPGFTQGRGRGSRTTLH